MKLVYTRLCLVTLLIGSFFPIFAADAQFLAFEFSGKNAPDYPAIYGVYGDPENGVGEDLTDDPGFMMNLRVRYVRYLSNNLQFYAATSLGYTGSYLTSLGVEESGDQKYYMLDSNSDVMFRYFIEYNTILFLGVRYNYMLSNGEYKAQTTIDSTDRRLEAEETVGVDKYEYDHRALGYKGGFYYVPTIVEDLHMMITCSYTYFPENTSEMNFKLYGDYDDANSSSFNIHNPEANIGFRLFTQAKKMFEFEVGCRFAYFMYTNLYEDKSEEKIYTTQKVSYFEVAPYVELIFPIY